MVAKPQPTRDSRQRAMRWFWALLVLSVLLAGALSRELAAPPAPATGIAVAVTGAVAVLALAQATRLWLALTGHRRRDPGA